MLQYLRRHCTESDRQLQVMWQLAPRLRGARRQHGDHGGQAAHMEERCAVQVHVIFPVPHCMQLCHGLHRAIFVTAMNMA